jgi:DNA repair exonuclease SbcCD ATPase subunit
MDLSRLRAVVDQLAGQQDGVTHSLEQHVTYFKHLDERVRDNQQAFTLLSGTLKSYAVKIQDTFQEVASKLEWGAKQKEIAATIRQIEFSLTVLEASIDGLMEALQTVIREKIRVRLISPGTLFGD